MGLVTLCNSKQILFITKKRAADWTEWVNVNLCEWTTTVLLEKVNSITLGDLLRYRMGDLRFV